MQLSKLSFACALLALAGTTSIAARAEVGVSITLAQPGVYGRIDLGGAPPPPVISAQPLLIAPVQANIAPVYLYVPLEHQRHWRRYCRQYNACGVPVYFVRDDWYHREYEPRFAERREHGRPEERRGEERRGDERRGDDHRGEDRRGEDRRGDDRR